MTDLASPTQTRSAAGFDLTPPSDDERARLEAALSPEEKRVLLALEFVAEGEALPDPLKRGDGTA